jgi:hypothetical protein
MAWHVSNRGDGQHVASRRIRRAKTQDLTFEAPSLLSFPPTPRTAFIGAYPPTAGRSQAICELNAVHAGVYSFSASISLFIGFFVISCMVPAIPRSFLDISPLFYSSASIRIQLDPAPIPRLRRILLHRSPRRTLPLSPFLPLQDE